MRRLLGIAAAVALLAPASLARAEDVKGSIQIKGSDTMVNLCQAWAEAFMKKNPNVTVAVTGGGSGTGFAALIARSCDLAAASRAIKPQEIEQAKQKGFTPQEWRVALDGLAVVVHPSNPVKKLTIAQLRDLFTGKITNWSEVGGPNKKITLLSREVNSGTHVYFKENVLGNGPDGKSLEYSPDALLLPSSQAIADEVASNPGAIGYYGMGYLNPNNAAVAVAKDPAGPFVTPSEATVRSGEYPISRPLMFYSPGEPTGAVKVFLDFVLSPDGQRIVHDTDFVPLKTQ